MSDRPWDPEFARQAALDAIEMHTALGGSVAWTDRDIETETIFRGFALTRLRLASSVVEDVAEKIVERSRAKLAAAAPQTLSIGAEKWCNDPACQTCAAPPAPDPQTLPLGTPALLASPGPDGRSQLERGIEEEEAERLRFEPVEIDGEPAFRVSSTGPLLRDYGAAWHARMPADVVMAEAAAVIVAGVEPENADAVPARVDGPRDDTPEGHARMAADFERWDAEAAAPDLTPAAVRAMNGPMGDRIAQETIRQLTQEGRHDVAAWGAAFEAAAVRLPLRARPGEVVSAIFPAAALPQTVAVVIGEPGEDAKLPTISRDRAVEVADRGQRVLLLCESESLRGQRIREIQGFRGEIPDGGRCWTRATSSFTTPAGGSLEIAAAVGDSARFNGSEYDALFIDGDVRLVWVDHLKARVRKRQPPTREQIARGLITPAEGRKLLVEAGRRRRGRGFFPLPFNRDNAACALRPTVLLFALAMEEKLRENDSTKPGWTEEETDYLLHRLDQETTELHDAARTVRLAGEDSEEAELPVREAKEALRREAADVGNLAMMLADNEGDLRAWDPLAALGIEEAEEAPAPRQGTGWQPTSERYLFERFSTREQTAADLKPPCCQRHGAMGVHTRKRHSSDGPCGAIDLDDLGMLDTIAREGLASRDPESYAPGALDAVRALCARLRPFLIAAESAVPTGGPLAKPAAVKIGQWWRSTHPSNSQRPRRVCVLRHDGSKPNAGAMAVWEDGAETSHAGLLSLAEWIYLGDGAVPVREMAVAKVAQGHAAVALRELLAGEVDTLNPEARAAIEWAIRWAEHLAPTEREPGCTTLAGLRQAEIVRLQKRLDHVNVQLDGAREVLDEIRGVVGERDGEATLAISVRRALQRAVENQHLLDSVRLAPLLAYIVERHPDVAIRSDEHGATIALRLLRAQDNALARAARGLGRGAPWTPSVDIAEHVMQEPLVASLVQSGASADKVILEMVGQARLLRHTVAAQRDVLGDVVLALSAEGLRPDALGRCAKSWRDRAEMAERALDRALDELAKLRTPGALPSLADATDPAALHERLRLVSARCGCGAEPGAECPHKAELLRARPWPAIAQGRAVSNLTGYAPGPLDRALILAGGTIIVRTTTAIDRPVVEGARETLVYVEPPGWAHVPQALRPVLHAVMPAAGKAGGQ